ncbi:12014_t:CDS:1 [Acaulospora morrowiae]|uniref:12014_t:CDS:1 n=1 Tax=Acaulospora morrowiae TaxID=94023 RepID=A0A9N9CCB9_9GLOM|nr:12014_t:CDS:1 [Acaulospora morrowiae]
MPAPQHITHLIRLDSLCKDWSSIHSHSCALFSSLINILTQRHTTTDVLQNISASDATISRLVTNVNFSSISLNPLDQVLTSQTLSLVIYKQSREIENVLTKIHKIIDDFEEILKSMESILSQNNKILFGPLMITNALSSTLPNSAQSSPSSSPKKQKKKSKSSSKSKQTSKSGTPKKQPPPDEQKVDDATYIQAPLSNFYISEITRMYERELTHKRNLMFGGALKIDLDTAVGVGGIKSVSERWAAQPHIDFEIEEEMADRIKIWKTAKELGQ